MGESDQPFFLTVNLPDAHWPVQNQVQGRPKTTLSEEDVRPMGFIGFDNKRMRGHIRGYYNCMTRLDECVGELLTALDKSGHAENTLVIYIGDHGAQFSRGKIYLNEGGLRIPFMVRWPGNATPGLVSEQMVSTIDLLPTILSAAGVVIPGNVPGHNLAPVLNGESKPIRQYLFGERNSDAAILHFPQRAIRDTRYKLIKTLMPGSQDPASHKYLDDGVSNFSGSPTYKELESADEATKRIYDDWLNPPEYQLFDLEKDPNEFVNLAAEDSMADVKQRLMERLETWQVETDDMLRKPELLNRLTAEVEDCLEKNRRVPQDGWGYLKYLQPKSKSRGLKSRQLDNEPSKCVSLLAQPTCLGSLRDLTRACSIAQR